MESAAKISLDVGRFSSVEFVWALTSSEVVEMINTHRINCGVVSAASVVQYKSSLNIQHLFEDEIVWVVPDDVPEGAIAELLSGNKKPCPHHDALNRYVEVGPGIPWQQRSDNWFRSELPHATPYFSCMTHQAAVDLVAAGVATCHSPLSLLPNLSEQVRGRVRCYRLDEHVREAVLVMPKHLLTLRPFLEFQQRITSYFEKIYAHRVSHVNVMPLPDAGEIAAQ